MINTIKRPKILNHKNEIIKIIGIIGTRRRDTIKEFKLIHKTFFEIYTIGDIICSGGCKQGGDRFAKLLHQKYDIPYLEFPFIRKLGKGGGFVRNTDIAFWSNPIIATVSSDRKGGTEDTLKKHLKFWKDKAKQIII